MGVLEGVAQAQAEPRVQAGEGLGEDAAPREAEPGAGLLFAKAREVEVAGMAEEVGLAVAEEESATPEAAARVGGEGAVEPAQVPPRHLDAAPQQLALGVAHAVGEG